jgi:hypothetical protein
MRPEDRDEFQRINRRTEAWTWLGLFGGSIALGLLVGFAWTFAVGIPLTIVLVLVALPLQLRLSKARWMRRFPELRDADVAWPRRRH